MMPLGQQDVPAVSNRLALMSSPRYPRLRMVTARLIEAVPSSSLDFSSHAKQASQSRRLPRVFQSMAWQALFGVDCLETTSVEHDIQYTVS